MKFEFKEVKKLDTMGYECSLFDLPLNTKIIEKFDTLQDVANKIKKEYDIVNGDITLKISFNYRKAKLKPKAKKIFDETKQNTYFVELSEKGMEIFKGGNIEVMKKAFINFKANNMKRAEEIFYNHMNETIGTSGIYQYKIREVKQ